MDVLRTWIKRITLLSGLWLVAGSTSGCLLFEAGYLHTSLLLAKFFVTTPLIPVSPYWSQEIEDTLWEQERYDKVPILDPVEGENAPLHCMDDPMPDEIMRTLPDDTKGGVPFLAETTRNNVRMVVEPIVDKLGECRFIPMVGPARVHKCHYKCTIYFDKVIRSDWPIPHTFTDATQEVVYIDHDHLIRCAGPAANGE